MKRGGKLLILQRGMLMEENLREVLNRVYRPIVSKSQELMTMLTKAYGDAQVTCGFFNGHYHKTSAGQYQADAYPIFVISVMGLCDIEIDFDGIAVTSKLSREQARLFDWSLLKGLPFEVYGVEEYLNDYGGNDTSGTIGDRILLSAEKELFVSLFLPAAASGDEVIQAVNSLQMNHFYY